MATKRKAGGFHSDSFSSHADRVNAVTGGSVRLQPENVPRFVSDPVTHGRIPIRSLPVTATISRGENLHSIEIEPSVSTREPSDAEKWDLRFGACCEVANVLVESFRGGWRRATHLRTGNELGLLIYTPEMGTRISDVERAAVAAFAIRGMHARSN